MTEQPPPASNRRNRSRSPAWPPATPRCARSAAAATICTIAATTSSTSPTSCEFEEIAYLLIHGKLPNHAELAGYKAKLKRLRGLPHAVKTVLEQLPAATHPMDVMRTGVSALGCVLPEKDDHNDAGARDIADRLIASLGSMLAVLVSLQPRTAGASRSRPTTTPSAGTSCTCCIGRTPSRAWVQAMHTSLILYAEHEFNASTFTGRVIAGTGSDMYSAITGAIGALRGPKHGGANEVAFEIQKRYDTPDEAEADIRKRVANKEVIIGFGHPVYTISDPRNEVIKEVARTPGAGRGRHEDVRHRRAPGDGDEARSRRCSRTSIGTRRCRIT